MKAAMAMWHPRLAQVPGWGAADWALDRGWWYRRCALTAARRWFYSGTTARQCGYPPKPLDSGLRQNDGLMDVWRPRRATSSLPGSWLRRSRLNA